MTRTFNDLPIGTIFRALRNDIVGKGTIARIVNNNGMYAKVGHNVSVDITKHVDCIFRMDMPVREVVTKLNVDVTQLASYRACNKGAAA